MAGTRRSTLTFHPAECLLSRRRSCHISHVKRKERQPCPVCGVKVENLQAKYCSQSCHQRERHEQWVARWMQNDPTLKTATSNGLETSNYIRRWLEETYGNQCVVCGWAEVHPTTKRVPVQIDHVDGDATNNRPENLRLLCPNHHSLTPTYGALNKGNGRAARYAPLAQR